MGGSEGFHASIVERWFSSYRHLLGVHADALDAINLCPVPDHDTGGNLVQTVSAMVTRASSAGADPASVTEVCALLVEGAAIGCRGNSGTILAEFARGLLGHIAGVGELSGASLLEGWRAGVGCTTHAVADVLPGSMITVAAAAGEPEVPADADLAVTISAMLHCGFTALDATRTDNPDLAASGVLDAGAAGLLLLLDALAEATAVEPAHTAGALLIPLGANPEAMGSWWPADLPPAAATALEVRVDLHLAANVERGVLLAALAAWGTSIAVAGEAGRVACHLHVSDEAHFRSVRAALAALGTVIAIEARPLLP